MAINPPEGIADFLAFVSGMEWPEADEDLMRRVSEHYGSIARDLETLSGYVIELIPIVKNDFDGEAADSFLVAMRDLTGQTAGANQLEQTAELSRQLSEVALKVANQVEYSKIMAILQLVQLLAEILFATLFSAFTFGAVWGPVSALFAATREGLHQLFRWLLQTILSQTFIGIMGGIFQDTVIQLYQLNAGHITTWNTESLIDSIKQGALSGLVAGPLEILSHYGGNLLGRLLGGKTPGSIISKRVDDVLNKIDDKLDDITPNPKPDVPTGAAGGAGAKSKLDDLASKTDKDLPPIPPNKAPDVTPPPVPPKTVGDGIVPPPATGKPKAETPGGAPAKDKPNTPATGTPGAPATGKGDIPTKGKGDVPTTGKGGVPAPGKGDVPTPGKGDVPATGKPDVPATGKGDVPTTGKGDLPATGKTDTPSTDKPDVPAANKTETVGGNEAPGAGKAAAGDAPTAGTSGKTPDASTAGRAAGDAGTPLDDLLATKEARSAFAKDVGELLGGVSRNLETGFMRLGEGTIAESFSKKMGDVFSEHLGKEGAREAGEAFGEMLTRKWVRLGADHTELPELLTKAMGDFGQLAPLKNLADSMPNLFNRSEHSNALARVFKQENPLQGSPMYQLGGAVASLLNEGTNEMLSEGFYNLIFGDGTFTVSGGPFAAGVAMGALSHGLHRAFEPIMVRYQNWVLSHQHAENPHDSKYFGLLHPINIASFVANMTGNPAPWPVPRPTSEAQQDPSFTRDMKDMVKWVFSNPITGTPFFADLPQRPDVTVESDGDGAFAPLDLDLGPSFGDEIAKDPLFRTESDGDTSTDDGGRKESEEGSDTPGAPSQATVSSDLSSLLGGDTDGPAPNLTDQDRATARPVTQSDGDRFTTPVQQENGSPARTEAQAEATTVPRPHPLQAEMDRAAAEGLDYLIPYDGDDDTAVPDNTTAPVHTTDSTMSTDSTTTVGDDGGSHHTDGDQGGDDGTTPPPDAPVRDIPSGIAVGVLSPAQTTALQSIPQRPGVFVVGMHTDPNTPHDPDAVLKALTDAHDDGRLDGITEIQFTACGLASPVHENTVKTVMSGLWKHRATTGTTTPDPLTARAADAPVWYVPTTGGDSTGGHLLTAQHIGLTPDGKIAVVDEGTWHVYGDTGGPDHTPVRTTPDADALPNDAVRFLFRTPAIDAEHPDAVKFGPDNGLPDPLTRHLPREKWAALLSDPTATADLLAEVTDTPRSPDGPWHTMDAEAYQELRKRLGVKEGDGPSADAVEEAFSSYSPDPADDATTRLEAVVTLVRDLHADADDGPLTPDVQILLQRLLQDQGFPPARLPDAARTTAFWTKNEPGFLAAELTLGIADATDPGNAPLTGALAASPAATPSDDALSELLQDPDGGQKALLRELLDGAHRPESTWHTLDATAYLALRTRVEGGPLDEPGENVRNALDQILNDYRASLEKATTRVDQLKAVAEAVLSLHATAGVPGSPENALTAHSRFLVPRMLLDLGITPVPLPDKLHAKAAWQTPRMPKMRASRVLSFATSVADSIMNAHPSWSRPLTSAPADGGTPDITSSDDQTTGTSTSTTSDAPVAPHTPAPQDDPSPGGNEAPEPKDWREELNALGTPTGQETTAYLVLPEYPLGLVGKADRLLRTDHQPYTTLTKDLPSDTKHWLAVRVPTGHGVDTGDGRILVGKDRVTTVTLTGPDDVISSIQALEQGLRPPGSSEQPLPLAVLSRVGQALHVNPGKDENHTVVRTAVRMAYAEASRDAERALGEHLAQRADVHNQVRLLVKAAWDKLSVDERRKLGTAQNTGSGSVGDSLDTLKEVVENGNIREQMHLLVTGVHGPLMKQLVGNSKPEPSILTRERSSQSTEPKRRMQQDADVVQNIRREQERLQKDEAGNPDLEKLLLAQEHRRRTELRPEEAVPPLSARERAHALDGDRLTWEPGERHRQIAMPTVSQVTAEATGGLMSAGTSNTTYFTLTVVHAMAKKWGVSVDYQLVRLALMADMLPIGHHTFHEVMTASEAFEQNVLAAKQPKPAGTPPSTDVPPYIDVLSYTDDWSRFRSLPPLTENTLREAMPGGRFPDEVALGLEAHERTSDTPSSLSPDGLPSLSPDTSPSPSPVRRTHRALPDGDLAVLVKETPGLTPRTTGLLREALGDGTQTSRDWRRFDAESFLSLRERVTRPDEGAREPQSGVWDELGSVMERLLPPQNPVDPEGPETPVVPEADLLRQNLDSAFDAYYTAVAGDPGDRSRLTALADLLVDIRKTESLRASDPDVSAALGVVAQRLLVDQGYPPALWGTDIGSPDFWPGDTPGLVQKLETSIGDFTRAQRVRQTPSGIAVGPMNPAQSRALNSLPPSPGVFTVGTHTDPDAPHDPDVLLKALTDAHDDGRLNGITEIRFTGCDLATPLHDTTVKTVMSGLWKHRATTGTTTPDPLTARAADAPVWYVPTISGNPADSRLLTAQHIGLTPDGKIAVVGQGTWHVYGDSGNPDHTPVRTTPDADTLPGNTVRFPSRTPENDAEHPDAVKFGRFGQSPPDNGEGSSSSARSQPHQTSEQSPPDNGEGSNTGAVPHPHQTPEQTPVQTPPGDSPLATARDARIEDLVRIRYMQESEAFERRLADHLFDLAPVQEMAAFLARAVVGTFRGTPLYDSLSQPSRSVPGAVGTRSSEWERVAASGNARERMTLFFQAIASTALPTLVGFPADYPRSLHQERLQRENNPDSEEYKTLDAFRQQLGPTRWNSPEHARANERWRALDSVLRPFRAVEVHPPLSATEERRAVNSRGRMVWNPGGASLRIRMDQMYQRAAEQAGRLVRSGTSGSGFYFHRYAEMLAGRLNMRIDHRDLRLAVIAAFVSEGHHTLPEVLAASSLFAEEYLTAVPRQEGQPPRPDVQALLQPVGDPTPAWDRYSVLPPLSPDHLRRQVARDGLFPHEHAENLRRELEEQRGPDPQATEDTDSGSGSGSGSDVSYETDTASDESYETDSDGTEDDSDDSDGEGTSHGGDVLGKGTSRRDDSSPHVPEDSPHSLPGQLRPEEVSPADLPVTADRWSAWQWTPGRQDVPPPARIRTERFDPAADPDVTGPFPGTADRRNEDGTLAGHRTRISADVQRFVVPPGGDGAPGGTVRLVRVTLPVAVDGSWSAADVTALGERLQGLLDSRVNLGFRLPRGGDQLHMEVVLDPRPVPLDGTPGEDWITVSRDAGPGNRSDQLHFRLHSDDTDPDVRGRDDAMLLHEVLHYAGLPDRYHDAETLFRHTPDRADASGVMATATLPDGTLPRRYLEAVEDVTESGPVLHDNLGPGTWSAPESVPVRDIPAGIAVGVLSPAQTSALRAFPPSPGVFVVGMHTDPNTPHDPDAVLKALTEAHDDGRLDGVTEIQFTACGLASPVHENTVKTVMSGLWKHRSDSGISTTPDPLTARAADAPVWYIPTTGGDTTAGHLLTAQHIGLTPDGKIAVVDQGTWHVYGDTGGPDHTPVRTTPDADTLPENTVRFPSRTPENATEHLGAVKFGPDNGLPDPLTRHVPRERWAALLSDPATTGELLTEVTATRRSPGDPWHTMDAKTYGDLRRKLGVETDGPSADTFEEAFSSYAPDPADDATTRLEAVVTLIRDLHADADEGTLTPDVQILLQRLLQDQGFPPARLPDAARTTTFWTKNEPGFLAAELTLGIADATEGGSASLTGEISVAPVATPLSDQSLSDLLQDPDGGQKTLLRELLDGAHRPESSWHTLDATTYLALRTRVEGGPPDEPGKEVRDSLDQVLNTYRASLEKATTRVDQLKAVAEAVLSLHAIAGVPGSPENALTAHSRFLVPRMLLDLGITPVPLPDKLHAKAAWQTPRMPKMRATRVLNFATSVADSIMNAHPSWSRPLTSAPADGGGSDGPPSGDPTAGGDTPDASAAPGTPAHQDGAAPAGDGAPEPRDWREELKALGTRTKEESTAYLVLPESPVGLVGRADQLLRTDDRPYTTLTKDLPSDTGHWLAVRVPAGHGIDTGDGRILVGKDRMATVTLTGPDDVISSIQALEQGLRPPGSSEQPLPLAVLSRVGQALHVNPDHDENHTTVRTAARVAYAEASRDAERALGEHLTQRADVHNQVRALVKAAWDNLSDVERLELGSEKNSGSGSVGNDLTTLKAVVTDGNIREQMHLLVSGVHGPLMKQLGLKKPEPEILTRERSAQGTPEDQRIQQDTDVVRDIRREQERLRKDEAANPDLEALVRAAERHRRTELRPEDAVPPLSARERAHALEDGRLTWEPGERHRQIALRTKSQVTAEATGGLMSAGTSNTTYFTLTVVHAMAQKWKIPVDFQLVRLALMADMLPIGHHTFHEVMTASEAFEQNVLAARRPQSAGTPPYTDVLSYTDDWGRFRSLAPLTEDALRLAMPGGRFPDEVALGLEAHERIPHALSSLSSDRRNLRALPDPELTALLRGTPGLPPRATGLLREALGDGTRTSRDWRRFDADSFLDLHERATRPDDTPGEPQRGVWDELDSIMERWYGMDPDIPEPDPLRQNLNASFDAYYTALAGDPGDGTRLTALAGLLLKLREGGNLPAEGADVSAALGVVTQRLLVDQGYPPALWGTDIGSPDFWPNDAPSLVRKLEAAIGDFTRLHPVRQTPTGIAVGPMSAAQSRALGSLPPSPGVFVVGTHTDPDTPHDPGVLLKALTDAHDQGRLTGITEIRFTGCDLATPLHENTVRTVMSGLWKHRAETGTDTGPLTALAADAPVWHVPGGDGLFTARRVGVTADGKVTVFGDGADWHRYSDTGAPDHTAESVPVGDDGAPADAVRTTRGDDPAFEKAVGDEHDRAVSFGETDNGEGSSESPRQQPLDFSAKDVTPASAPWYVTGSGALGDGRVLSVTGPAEVARPLREAGIALTRAGVTEETAGKIMKRLRPLLTSTDTGVWNGLLRNGLVFHTGGKVVVVTARPDGLTHHAAQPEEDLAPHASRGQAVTNRAVSTGGSLSASGGVDAVVKLANVANLTGLVPSVKVQAGTAYTTSRTATADTQGVGRTVLKGMHEFDGHVRVEVRVLDGDGTRAHEAAFAFPQELRLALPEGIGPPDETTAWKVVAPDALKSALSTVNALAPGPLLADLASAMGRAGFAPSVTAAFVSKVATDFFNEKSLKDGNQWWSAGNLTSGVFSAGGFPRKSLAGHFLVGAELTSLRKMGETSEDLRVREDFSDAFGVKSSSRFGDKSGLTVAVSFLTDTRKPMVVPSLELAVNAARSHNSDVGGSDKARTRLKHAEEKQAEYRATARFHVEFLSASKRTALSFDSALDLAVGVPSSQSDAFETRLLGSAREEFRADPPTTDPPGPPPPWHSRVGQAVRDLLRLSRQGPSLTLDVGRARPFPSGGIPDPAELLRIADRHPVEIVPPNGILPDGATWKRLDEHSQVTVVTEADRYGLAHATRSQASFRYHLDTEGRITAAQRLRTSTFTELFGPLEPGDAGLTQLTQLSARRPWLGFTVHRTGGTTQHVPGTPTADGLSLTVREGDDGQLVVEGSLRHPVEQLIGNLAEDDSPVTAEQIMGELESLDPRHGPMEVRVAGDFAGLEELRTRLGERTDLVFREETDPRRPTGNVMRVDGEGALHGPFRQKSFEHDPLEPPALASRAGIGPGAVGELPGSHKVMETARDWLDRHLERTDLSKRLNEAEYAQFHRELTAAFGTAGMRARFPKLLGSGVPLVLKAGDQEIRLHLRSELLDLRDRSRNDGLSLTRSVARSANQAVGVADQVALSAALGTTLRFDTRENQRAEPGGKIGVGGTPSNVKDSVATTLKASREQETSGPHTVFTYAAVHHLTATVHDSRGDLVSGSSLRVEGDDVSAVVRVGDDHLPNATDDRRPVGHAAELAPGHRDRFADTDPQEFVLPRNGLGGVHPDFLSTRELTDTVVGLVAEHGGVKPAKPGDEDFDRLSGDKDGTLRRSLTPELEEVFTPTFLQSRFEQLTSPDGAVFPLPPDSSGRGQALVVRLRLGHPVHETSGEGTSLTYSAETGTKSSTVKARSLNYGGGVSAGGYASLDGKSVAAGVTAEATRTHTKTRTVASAGTGSSSVTYKGTSHHYRADAHYEITHHTWQPDGRLSATPSDHSSAGRYVKVDGGVELTATEHQARTLGMPGVEPLSDAAPEPFSYVDADLAKAVSHVEKLGADTVLGEIKDLLDDLKVLPDHLVRNAPTDLGRALETVFSPEALRANFAALTTTSVHQVVKLRQITGGTRLIGIQVTADLGDPTHKGPRDQVTLAMGDTATRSTASASGTSAKGGVQLSVTVKATDANGSARGGAKGGAGAETSVGRTETITASERDQHGFEITGTVREFSHPVTYTVKIFESSEAHQLARLAGAALSAPVQLIDLATDGRAGRWFAEQWGPRWEELFPSGHTPVRETTIPDHEARLLVPDHLTRPGTTASAPVEPVGRVRPDGPTDVPPAVQELTRALAPSVQALSLPGLDGVVKWLPTSAALPHRVTERDTGTLTRKDLAPATLAGLRADLLTTERNLRANIRQLLGDGYPVPVAGGEQIILRMIVRRTRHLTSGEFDANVETEVRERETEREHERTTLGWSGSIAPDGPVHSTGSGTPEGPGVTGVTTNLGGSAGAGGEHGHGLSTTRSETVDERDKKKDTQHYYKADVTWVLTGSRRTTVEVQVDGGLIGLLHDDLAEELADGHPDLFQRKPSPETRNDTETTPKDEDGEQDEDRDVAEAADLNRNEAEEQGREGNGNEDGSGDGDGDREQNRNRSERQDSGEDEDRVNSGPEVPPPSIVVTPPVGTGTGTGTGGAPSPIDPTRLAPPAGPPGPVPGVTVTPPDEADPPVVPGGDGPVSLDQTRLAPPATPPGPVPWITVTPPEGTPLLSAEPGLRITAYETVGTAPGARRTGEARVELFAEAADPIALALTGPPKDAGFFPAYRPVRPVGTAEGQPALQLSDDRRFAVPDQPGGAREFYATADAVAAARTRLLPAAGTRLEVDPESSVRFTLDGVEHTLHRVTVRGGDPGTVPLVLAGDAGSRHVTLQGDVRPELRDADMRRAVDVNLDHYGPELHALAETLERADPGRTDPRTVLARALADLHRTREEGAGPAALARAEAEAVRAFRDTVGDEYGSPEDDWQVRLAEPTAPVELSASDWSVF
ncbi:hypothetical protein [Streptomyces sp. NPDC094049]|uniref:WXG100-like domain-containing protein n=1 Tax=Streptomyces sp. NPDC094049 TaxID=3154987 RepID=UPI0033277E04